ncbi:MAG: methyl-accepting chemotaxis protein [Xenococcaceae cyanobacterium MO_188.B19]|nr:methyl-accepting chemotaxis protein [Xenococcaceae cyanobacterium MO_188.B19]
MSKTQASSLLTKIYNLPISRKTSLISYFTLASLAVIVAWSGFILRQSLKAKQFKQVESQLAVADIKYNIKIDQMGFGFRGQSDNTAIINITKKSNVNQVISSDLYQQVKTILTNEINARNIEYATLVGTNKKIIVNANQDRVGQSFDPNGLVTKALAEGKQIKSSEVVSWSELVKENSPLPEGLENQDALIRYTVTPVKDINNQKIIGALISGDIVNQKLPIVAETVAAFPDSKGYGAIYLRQPTGEFALATSLLNTTETSSFVPLPNTSLLEKSTANQQKTVTQKTKINGESYIMAAKTITNNSGEPIAIIVYGNSVDTSLFWTNLLTQIIVAGIVLAVTVLLTNFLGKAIAEPIQELQQVTQNFSEGDIKARAVVRTNDEIGLLASTFNILADSIEMNEAKLREDAKRSRILKEMAFRIGEEINPDVVFNIVVEDARNALNCDRVIVYTFNEQWQGKVVAESVESGFPEAINAEIYDPCFAEEYTEKYQEGRYQVISDIYQAGLTECHLQQLEPFKVKASMVTPILMGDKLIGLLIAHECSNPRVWEETEIDLLLQIANQSGNALEKASLMEQQQMAQENERQAKEQLQSRALELLMEVDPVSQGDLTIRAKVKEDEIGTIADSYNSTIESLRKLVTQVKTAANLVSTTTSEKEVSIQGLAEGASEQTQEIMTAIDRITAMADSIKAVAANAEAAEQAVQQASDTVKAGDEVMNRTVDGFKAIRETVAETAKKVKRLGESSQKISKVVNLISNFADQTNLLALNASIEAAHAGEEGRGFAVVADEVRSLARQSANATAEIESLVAEIQSETNEVVAAMESGTEQVVVGTKLVDETRSSLNRISNVSNQINELVNAIAQATVEQSQDSEVVTQTMTQVAAISEKTATEAGQVSDSFKELLTVAQQLEASVAKFKVS